MWLSREQKDTLSTEEKVHLVRQFAEMNPAGGVVLTGGEPFTKFEEVITLSTLCRQLNLLCVTNTNGTLAPICSIPRLLEFGPSHLVVSLDSWRPELHDYVRGRRGSFATTEAFVRALIQQRRQTAANVRISLSAILFDQTISESCLYIAYARELGVDGVTFQMLDRTFHRRGSLDKFFDRHWFADREAAKGALDELASRFEGDPFLMLGSEDFLGMKAYIDNPDALPSPVCGAHERNLVIDMHGNVQLCAYMTSLTAGRALGNARTATLDDLWNSPFAAEVRPIMAACVRPCGMLNCNRRGAA